MLFLFAAKKNKKNPQQALPGTITMFYFVYLSKSGGSVGMAPFWVHTKADTSTAFLWASWTGLPLMMLAQNEPVNESPAPTVSATSTFGVSWNEVSPSSVKTYEPLVPQVSTSIFRLYAFNIFSQALRMLRPS